MPTTCNPLYDDDDDGDDDDDDGDDDDDDDDDDDYDDDDDDDDDDYLLALNIQIVWIDHPTLIGKVGSSQSEGSAEN